MPSNTHAKGPAKPPLLRLRAEGWRKECARFNLAGDTQIAAHIGLPMTTYWRVRTEKVEPSTKFIKAALNAFPGSRFEDLFLIERSARRAA
jgi:hypothetical protein